MAVSQDAEVAAEFFDHFDIPPGGFAVELTFRIRSTDGAKIPAVPAWPCRAVFDASYATWEPDALLVSVLRHAPEQFRRTLERAIGSALDKKASV